MLKSRALEKLAGVSSIENRQAGAPSNIHAITGEVGSISEDGRALIRIDGLVFSADNSQYVEMDTLGGLEEGDTVTILLTGEQGHAMAPLAIGGVGTVDRMVTRISNIEADYVKTNVLEANYAQIDAANIDTATIREAWVDNILVQSGLIAHEGTIFELDAIQINASKIKTGTIDVERLVVTGQDGHKYLVHVNGETASYEKLDGDIIEDLTITADKIVAGSITAQKITTENLVGTGGWINLRSGTFQYGNPQTGEGISWDGTNLTIGGYLKSSDASNTYATKASATNAAKTATNFLTTIGSSGLFVHKSGDSNVSTGNGVKITNDIDILRSGTSRLHIDSDSVDINDANGAVIGSLTGSTEEPSAGNDNRTTKSSALTMGDTTLGKASFEASLIGKDASSGSYEYKLTSSSLKAQRDVGEAVDAIAIIAAEVCKQYNTSKSAYEVISNIFLRGDYLAATTRTSNQLYRIDMASFEKLLGCRIDIAWTSINVRANSGGGVTLTWANGGFKDSNYIVSPSRMTGPNGYTKVQFAITSRTATTVTLGYWNDGSTAINGMNVGVIGVDSRYASLII